MMLCARGREWAGAPRQNMPADLIDIGLALLLSPIVWVFVTRAPVLSTFIFSSLLVSV